MAQRKNYIGQTSGRLMVIGEADEKGKRKLICQCECGNTKTILAGNFSRGHTRSCGCLKREIVTSGAHTTHGLRNKNIRLYNIWKGMRRRCTDSKGNRWNRYGGRGITVCEEWNEYPIFYKWAMDNGYSDELSIDRIDNDKGYSPENCRWQTSMEQCNNRSSNRLIQYNGESHSVAEWGRITGLGASVIEGRLHIGWTEERALSEPIVKK